MSQLNILMDGSVLCNTYQKGIQRYLRELLLRIRTPFSLLLGDPPVVPFPADWPVQRHAEYGRRPQYNFIKRGYRAFKRRFPPAALQKHDLFHSVFYTLPPPTGNPMVAVVYDMVCELLPEYYPGDARKDARTKHRALAQADAIITISEATRADLARVYPSLAGKTTAVPLGIEHLSCFSTREKSAQANPDLPAYALFVGYRGGYKNFTGVLDAMANPYWPDGLALRVAGPAFSPGEEKDIRLRSLSSRLLHCGRPDDATLVNLYREASVFVFPSLLEGFGFPLLEAQLLGVPVAASNIPVFAEVGGDVFESFNPHDPARIAQSVARALKPARSAVLAQLGPVNALRFSWETTARMTEEVWRTVSATK